MNVARLRNVLLAAAVALALPAAAEAPPAAAPKPFEDVIRLHAAGLSDDFIVRKIARDGAVYALTTDDIIACKKAGLPEPVIEAMLKTSPGPEAAPAPAPAAALAAAPAAAVPVVVVAAPVPAPAPVPPAPAAPSVAVSPAVAVEASATAAPTPAETPAPAPSPAPTPAPAAVAPPPPVPVPPPAPVVAPAPAAFPDRTFGGLVRRAPGVVLFKNPWEPGSLAFRGGELAWTDASDPSKNVVVPAADLTEQFLVCPKETDYEGACWEWGVKTASGELRFRDEAWEKAPSGKPAEIWGLVRAAMPALHDARYRTSKKK